jgi:cytochrome P450
MTDTEAERGSGPATQALPGDLHWDPFDPDLKGDPYPVWRRLREEAPCYHNEEFDFWTLSRFEDVDAAHRDPSIFSSAHGIVLERMSPTPVDSGMMISRDPPEHTRLG